MRRGRTVCWYKALNLALSRIWKQTNWNAPEASNTHTLQLHFGRKLLEKSATPARVGRCG